MSFRCQQFYVVLFNCFIPSTQIANVTPALFFSSQAYLSDQSGKKTDHFFFFPSRLLNFQPLLFFILPCDNISTLGKGEIFISKTQRNL